MIRHRRFAPEAAQHAAFTAREPFSSDQELCDISPLVIPSPPQFAHLLSASNASGVRVANTTTTDSTFDKLCHRLLVEEQRRGLTVPTASEALFLLGITKLPNADPRGVKARGGA